MSYKRLNPERSKTLCLVLFLFVGAGKSMRLSDSHASLLPLATFTLFTASVDNTDENESINSTAPRARHVQCTPGRRRPVFSSNSTSSLFQQKRSFWRLPRRMFEACVSFCTQPAVITTIKSFQCFPMILCERMVPKCGSGTFMNLTSEKLSTASAIRK